MTTTPYVITTVEETSGVYTANVVDETGAAVTLASVSAVTLNLIDKETGTVINSRSAQNVLNTNNCTYSAGGLFTWNIQPADVAIVTTDDDPPDYETHEAVVTVEWGSGKKMNRQILMRVRNLQGVT